jgi:phosphate/sulfate permease
MLTHLDPASVLAIGLVVFALAMVMMFEATNGFHDGFHDAANAVLVFTCTAVSFAHALCLGIGTMIAYKRIVTTLGDRLGRIHLTPAQGAAAHGDRSAGLQYGVISRILMA